MLMCEELFLLLTDDEGKPVGFGTQKGIGLASAVLTDLIVAQRITVEPRRKDADLALADPAPTGSPVLDAAIARLCKRKLHERTRRFSSLVQDSKLNPQPQIVEELARARVIRIEERRVLGFPTTRYSVRDPGPERELRRRLRRVLSGAQSPTVADATELSVLQALGVAPKVLKEEAGRLSNRELKQRINEVAADVPAADAVAKAIQAVNTAILTAVIIPAAVAGGSS